MLTRAVAGLLVCLVAGSAAAQAPDVVVKQLLAGPQFAKAGQFLDGDYDRFVKELIALTEIPAPPFKESTRAAAVLERFKALGLQDAAIDGAGNVTGIRKGTGGAGLLAVLAHLDTVFPEGTDVTVKREGTKLMAPGVGDDTRGLALMLQVIRALDAGGFTTANDILFVANVGEEGEGDLRGAKYLFSSGPYKGRITHMVAIDGGRQSGITTGGLGSRRYRVTFSGPGGHSYGAFGIVNPAFAMGTAIAKVGALTVPSRPRTTFNVGVVSGGTSVNSIPASVQMDVDLRSESCAELHRIDAEFLGIVKDAVAAENAARSTREGAIVADPKLIGDRPCGQTALTTPLVQTASAAIRAFGLTPSYGISSTDANVPMSLDVPAITIGHGEGSARAHSPDESTDVPPAAVGQAARIALTIIASSAGL